MLAIKKRYTAVKAITAGSVAFVLGLTGAAAFIGDNFQPAETVYDQQHVEGDTSTRSARERQQVDSDTSATIPAKTEPADETQSDEAVVTETSSGTETQPADTTWTPVPAVSSETSAATSLTPTITEPPVSPITVEPVEPTLPTAPTAEDSPTESSDSLSTDRLRESYLNIRVTESTDIRLE